jgi:hypothetical protein
MILPVWGKNTRTKPIWGSIPPTKTPPTVFAIGLTARATIFASLIKYSAFCTHEVTQRMRWMLGSNVLWLHRIIYLIAAIICTYAIQRNFCSKSRHVHLICLFRGGQTMPHSRVNDSALSFRYSSNNTQHPKSNLEE